MQTWPIPGFTLEWFEKALDNPGVRDALWMSVKAALGRDRDRAAARDARRARGRRATASSAARRSRSSCILPIALPGIVTGMALNATFREVLEPFGIELGLFTVIVGHATFCIVVVYNNVVARMRRIVALVRGGVAPTSARHRGRRSAYVTLPAAALGAARRRRCSPSRCRFDEVIVTTFTAGARADAADLDPRQPLAPEPAADRQRRRRVRDPALDRSRSTSRSG